MFNTEIKLIVLFAAEDGEALYSQQKQDWELTLADMRADSHETRRKGRVKGKM